MIRKALGPRDLLGTVPPILAGCLGVRSVLSFDRDLDRVPGVTRLDPAESVQG